MVKNVHYLNDDKCVLLLKIESNSNSTEKENTERLLNSKFTLATRFFIEGLGHIDD